MIGFVFLGIGLLLAVIALFLHKFFKRRQKKAVAVTTATVVDIVRHKRRNRQTSTTTYAPVYEYYANGTVHKVTSTVSSSPCRFRIGDQLELHFDPEKPRKIYVEAEERMLRFICLLLGGMGLLFAGIGVCLMCLL